MSRVQGFGGGGQWKRFALDGPPSGPASGDLGQPGGAPTPASGNYPNPAVVALQGRRVDPAAPAFGQALLWNGLSWAPAFVVAQSYLFGQETVPPTGLWPLFLPPGFDTGTPVIATQVPVKATQNQKLRFLHVQQTPAGVGAGVIRYEVFIQNAASPLFVTIPDDGTDANNVIALPPALSNNDVAFRMSVESGAPVPPSRVTAAFQGVGA